MEIIVDMTEFEEALAKLNPKSFKKAINTSLNTVGRRLKTQIARDINKQYNIKIGDVKRYMRTRTSRLSDLHWVASMDGKRRNIIHFGAKQNKKGVSVKINKQRGRKTISATNSRGGAFIHNGTVFQRVKGTRMKSNSKKQKIVALKTLSVPQMFKRDMHNKAEQQATKDFPKSFKRELEWYLGLK